MESCQFPQAGLLLGGYEWEEQPPRPFISLDMEAEEDVAAVLSWLSQLEGLTGEPIRVVVSPQEEGELWVQLKQGEKMVAAAEVWRDESWMIFQSLIRQGNHIWMMGSRQGFVMPDVIYELEPAALEITGE